MRKENALCATGVVLMLLGCASADPIKLPNGQMGFTIDCDGSGNGWKACYKRAAELCPSGYDIVTQGGSSTPVLVTTGPGMYTGGAVVERQMMIQCKTTPPAQ